MSANEISGFLADRKILILDRSSSSRQLIEKALVELGADRGKIVSMKSFQYARDFVINEKPEVIITEFQIHDDYGLDLVHIQQEYIPSPFQRVFIIVAQNAYDTAVADAAEEEVDSYILKPFTPETLVGYMAKCIKSKLDPSQYAESILESKQFIEDEKFEQALNALNIAKMLNDTPTIAHFYSGEVYQRQENYEKALIEYRKGLEHNRMHFKCLVGEFNSLNSLERHVEAYKALRKISHHFPLSPQLLKNAFILAIKTYNHKEVDEYYNRYIKIPRKTDDLKYIVSQALLTSGKMLLDDGISKQALNYFKKGAVINGRTPNYLHNIIDTLINRHLNRECNEFLMMFAPEELTSDLFRQLEFKVRAMHYDNEKLIEEGRKVIFEGNSDISIYCMVLQSAVDEKKDKMLIENIAYRGMDQFPDSKDMLIKFVRVASEKTYQEDTEKKSA